MEGRDSSRRWWWRDADYPSVHHLLTPRESIVRISAPLCRTARGRWRQAAHFRPSVPTTRPSSPSSSYEQPPPSSVLSPTGPKGSQPRGRAGPVHSPTHRNYLGSWSSVRSSLSMTSSSACPSLATSLCRPWPLVSSSSAAETPPPPPPTPSPPAPPPPAPPTLAPPTPAPPTPAPPTPAPPPPVPSTPLPPRVLISPPPLPAPAASAPPAGPPKRPPTLSPAPHPPVPKPRPGGMRAPADAARRVPRWWVSKCFFQSHFWPNRCSQDG